jgi:hypothetical protein
MNILPPFDEALTVIATKHELDAAYDFIGEPLEIYDDMKLGKASKVNFLKRIRDYVKEEIGGG